MMYASAILKLKNQKNQVHWCNSKKTFKSYIYKEAEDSNVVDQLNRINGNNDSEYQ